MVSWCGCRYTAQHTVRRVSPAALDHTARSLCLAASRCSTYSAPRPSNDYCASICVLQSTPNRIKTLTCCKPMTRRFRPISAYSMDLVRTWPPKTATLPGRSNSIPRFTVTSLMATYSRHTTSFEEDATEAVSDVHETRQRLSVAQPTASAMRLPWCSLCIRRVSGVAAQGWPQTRWRIHAVALLSRVHTFRLVRRSW